MPTGPQSSSITRRGCTLPPRRRRRRRRRRRWRRRRRRRGRRLSAQRRRRRRRGRRRRRREAIRRQAAGFRGEAIRNRASVTAAEESPIALCRSRSEFLPHRDTHAPVAASLCSVRGRSRPQGLTGFVAARRGASSTGARGASDAWPPADRAPAPAGCGGRRQTTRPSPRGARPACASLPPTSPDFGGWGLVLQTHRRA